MDKRDTGQERSTVRRSLCSLGKRWEMIIDSLQYEDFCWGARLPPSMSSYFDFNFNLTSSIARVVDKPRIEMFEAFRNCAHMKQSSCQPKLQLAGLNHSIMDEGRFREWALITECLILVENLCIMHCYNYLKRKMLVWSSTETLDWLFASFSLPHHLTGQILRQMRSVARWKRLDCARVSFSGRKVVLKVLDTCIQQRV